MTDATKNDIIFYDGTCGLCHGFVKWALRHDSQGVFRFAPLQGETVKQTIPAEECAALPDSIVILTTDRRVLTKSAAAEYMASRLGLRLRATMLRIFPRWFADFGYDVIARSRYWFFGRNRRDMCPIVPQELRERFLP